MAEKIYKLRYLSLFEEDLSEIIDYIVYKLRNKTAANELLNSIEAAILTRLKNPESFEKNSFAKEIKQPYYRIYVNNFIIYYVVTDDETDDIKIMEVRRILYSKRDKRKLL
jgi:Plasmid stabilization system protein